MQDRGGRAGGLPQEYEAYAAERASARDEVRGRWDELRKDWHQRTSAERFLKIAAAVLSLRGAGKDASASRAINCA